MIDVGHFLYRLRQRCNGRKPIIIVGDLWGDTAKRAVESALEPEVEAMIRVSGGANTGGTAWIPDQNGDLKKVVFHLVPSCWPRKTGIIGNRVLVNLDRLIDEIDGILRVTGAPKADLHLSKKAPIWLRYDTLLEAYIEHMKGSARVGTTGRGIGPNIAAVALRIQPLVGHLLYPDVLRKWIKEFYDIFEPNFRILKEALKDTEDAFTMAEIHPDVITEEILSYVDRVRPYITDVAPILKDFVDRNASVIYSMTQGHGIHFEGTYPFSSSGEILAAAAALCGPVPMKSFGPTILVSKLIPTRVGNGPFPTGWWDRNEAMQFPVDHPELFSDLEDKCDPVAREEFLKQKRDLINSGQHTNVDLAQYFEVLLNNLGATTLRGRECGGPDLHETACAAWANGADCIALTQVDVLGGLEIDFPIGVGYNHNGSRILVPVVPTPVEVYDELTVQYERLLVSLKDVDLYGATELPPVIDTLRAMYLEHTGVSVGMISTSPKRDGKIYYEIP